MKPKILPGCSSFYNRKWSEVFYPEELPSKDWFAYYCTQFNTFEINSTFYKMPTAKSLQTWHQKSPADFKFSLKVPKLITHINKLQDCEQLLNEFYTSVESIIDKVACVLFQFPPSYYFTTERLELLMKNMNPKFNNAVEFRHESWWIDDVYEAFRNNNIIFSNVNYPKLPTEIITTHPIGYLRLHGNPKLFYSEYSKEMLESLIKEIEMSAATEFYIYFNNTASTAGIINALAVRESMKVSR
jgi:uncharacterized protein YecE (DUF72 family)